MLEEIPETIKYPLSFLKRLRIYSERKTTKVLVMAILYTIPPMFLIFLALIQYSNIKGDVFEFVNNLEALVVFIHLVGKIIFIAYQQENLTKLIEKTKLFWNAGACEEAVKAEICNISSNILRVQKFFIPCTLVAILIMLITTFFGRPLALGIWNIEGHEILYNFVLGLQVPMLLFCGFFVPPFDCIFLAFCVEIALQFRILCHFLKQLSVTQRKYHSNIKMCIQHHTFLLRYVREFQNVYSAALLIEIITISPVVGAELYAVFEGTSVQLQIRHIVVCFCQIMQLAFYCIPVDYIRSEALSVSTVTYSLDWYSQYFSSARFPLIFLMQNSQEEITLSAGGLIFVRSTTLLTVLKLAWSVCTVMRGLREN